MQISYETVSNAHVRHLTIPFFLIVFYFIPFHFILLYFPGKPKGTLSKRVHVFK